MASCFRQLLGKDRAYTEAISTNRGAAVLFWTETQPARKPAFAEVRAKVSADYLENEKRKRFVELGRTLRGLIENRLKAGDTFEKAATAVNMLFDGTNVGKLIVKIADPATV